MSLISSVHLLVLVYGLYGGWVLYDEHIVQLEDVVSRGSGIDAEIAAAFCFLGDLHTMRSPDWRVIAIAAPSS